jgi:hypothetical protein
VLIAASALHVWFASAAVEQGIHDYVAPPGPPLRMNSTVTLVGCVWLALEQ